MSAVLDQFRQQFAVAAVERGGEAWRDGRRDDAAPRWCWAALAGRLVELSADGGCAALTLAAALVAQAQRAGAPAAWVTEAASSFYPPDLAAHGVALEALVVVRVDEPGAVARAGERLARAGAFGLVVLDLGRRARMAPPLQGRLAKHALRHETAVVCLTEKGPRMGSLGSLVSLYGQARRERRGEDRFAIVLTAAKDKRRGPGWVHEEAWHGPPGLR